MAEIEVIGPVQGFVSQEATIAPKQGIYESSDVARCALGTRIRVGPRTFYYARYGANTDRGMLTGQDESITSLISTDALIVDGNYGLVAGLTKLEITLASKSKDDFSGGFLHTTKDTGEGYCYGIRRSSKSGEKLDSGDPALASATTSLILELYDPLVEAVATTTDIAITGNLYYKIRPAVSSAGVDDCPVGIAPITFDVAVAPYGWIQTWGPCTALADDSGIGAKGSIASVSDGMEGAVECTATNPAVGEAIVGYVLEVAAATSEHMALFLQIMP